MFYDEDHDYEYSAEERKDRAEERKGMYLFWSLLLSVYVIALLVAISGPLQEKYDDCIAAGGNSVQCAQDQGDRNEKSYDA